MLETEIAILDFGSQYTHLLARRIRELGVLSQIYSHDVHTKKLVNAVGIILSGGPKSLTGEQAPKPDPALFTMKKPILGICYGHQLLAHEHGGLVKAGKEREYGSAELRTSHSPLFGDIPTKSMVWMSHGDSVLRLPSGFRQIATTGNNSITAMADDKRLLYGLQFHPEVNHTRYGTWMLSNFVFTICGAKKNWDSANMLARVQSRIREEAGDKKVFLLVSGGVDSTVCFSLLEKTLGRKRVYGFHVDHGFLRQDESTHVGESLAKIGLSQLQIFNAKQEFSMALTGVTDPEEKRKIIGNIFLDVTDRTMKSIGSIDGNWLLGQGTIYPDTIESGGTKNADKIKTHHNRVDRVTDMIEKGLIIEPIRDLYKDEVREIGRTLGLPSKLIDRHPFPGPGLAIRCLCSSGSDNQIKKIKTDPHGADLYILPIRSVGVQGDERSYAKPMLIASRHSWNELRKMSPQITNTQKNINRVMILLSGDKEKLLSAGVKKAYLSEDRITLLRKLDDIAGRHIDNSRCQHIWQMPVILIPFGHTHGESVVLRPVESKEAMTVYFGELPDDILELIIRDIQAIEKIDYIFYDITNKPPGTIEWE